MTAGPGTVTTRWLESAAEAGDGEFDGEYFCTSLAWIRGWERVRTEPVRQFRHLVLDGGSRPELVPFFLVDRSPQWDAYQDDAGVPPVWSGPVVFSSTLYGEHGGAGSADPGYLGSVVDLGLDQARRWSAQALILSNLTDSTLAAWSAARPGGTAVLLDRKYEAPVRGSETAFLAGMRGKVRREWVRQWRRAVSAGVQLRALRAEQMAPWLPDFTRLCSASAEKHGVNIYGQDIFAALMGAPGAVLLVAEHAGRMVGAFLCFLHRGRFAMVSGGLDYARLRELDTYAFLMYESLRYAVAHGAGILDPGRGNFVYKERHGFTGEDLWALVYLTEPNPAVQMALEAMDKGIHQYIARSSMVPLPLEVTTCAGDVPS